MDELEISGKRYISTRRAAKEYKYHADYLGQLIRGKKLVGRKVGRSWYIDLDSLTTYFGQEQNIPRSELVAKAVEQSAPVATQTSVQTEHVTPVAYAAPVETPALVPTTAHAPVFKTQVSTFSNFTPAQLSMVSEQQHLQSQPAAHHVAHIEMPEEFESPPDEVKINIHKPAASFPTNIPIRRKSTIEDQYKKENPYKNKLTYIEDDAPFMPRTDKAFRTSKIATVMPRTREEAEEVEDEQVVIKENKPNKKLLPIMSVAVAGALVLIVAMASSIFVNSKTVVETGKAATVQYSVNN
jgi:hypothetical protein